MKRLPFTLFYFSLFLKLVLSLSPKFLACQLKKSAGTSPLEGCPNGTLYVSPSDPDANFSSIQESIDSLPSDGHRFILIAEGQYFETLSVTRSGRLTLLGQLDPDTASVRGGNASQRNLVNVFSNHYVGEDGMTDLKTATLTVAPASGYSFGCTDFRAYNINFENRAANYQIGQALAISIMYANASFYGCVMASFQDTCYIGPEANSYAVDSMVYGRTDYMFGFGKFWFQSGTLCNRGCGGGMTAWQGSPDTGNGVYIADSRIIRSPDADPSLNTTQACYLGRPWNENALAVFLRNYMDDSIHPSRFTTWSGQSCIPNSTYYAEFQSYGPGGNISARVPQDQILSLEEASRHTLAAVFGGAPRWIDSGYNH